MNSPLSIKAYYKLAKNAFFFLLLFALPVMGAAGIHYGLEKMGAFDGLYPAVYKMHSGEEDSYNRFYDDWERNQSDFVAQRWVRKYDEVENVFGRDYYYYHVHGLQERRGPHLAWIDTEKAHDIAHNGEEYGYGGKAGELIPKPEEKFFSLAYWFVFALLFPTRLGPRACYVNRRKILAANQLDFEQNEKLKAGIMATQDVFAKEEGTAEPGLPGEWRVFDRIVVPEREDLRDSLGHYRGSITNLDELSAILWFTNGERALKVKVVNEKTIRHVVADMVGKWLGAEHLFVETHVGKTIAQFRFFKGNTRPTHALNAVLEDLGKPYEERRPVELRGIFQAEDLLLATGITVKGALEGGDVNQIVIPTGFIRRVLAEMKEVTGRELPPPELKSLAA